MTTLTTEAGRRLYAKHIHSDYALFARDILAVEDEARAAFAAQLREAVEKLPTWDKRTVPGGFHVRRAAVLAAIEEAERE